MKKLFFAMTLLGVIIFASTTTAVGQKQTNTVKTTTLNEKSDSVLTNLDQRLSIVDSMVKAKMNDFTEFDKLELEKLKVMYNRKVDVVGLVASVFFFISCVIIVFLVLWFNHKNKQKRYDIIMQQAIEKGQPVPILEEVKPKREKNAFYYLKNGIIIGGIGLPLIICAMVIDGGTDSRLFFTVGSILTGIGAAFIIIGRIKKKEEQRHLNE